MFFNKKAAGVFALAATASAYESKSGAWASSSAASSSSAKTTCSAKTVTSTSTTTHYKDVKTEVDTTVFVGYGPAKTVTVDADNKVVSTAVAEEAWLDWSADPESAASTSDSKSKYSTCADTTTVITTTVEADATTCHLATVFVGYGAGPTITVDGKGKTVGSYVPDGWSSAPVSTVVSDGGNGGWGGKGNGNGNGGSSSDDGSKDDGSNNGGNGGWGKGGNGGEDGGDDDSSNDDGSKNGGNGGWGGNNGGNGNTKTATATEYDGGNNNGGNKGGNGGYNNGNNDGGNGGKGSTKTATATEYDGDDSDNNGHGGHGNGGNGGKGSTKTATATEYDGDNNGGNWGGNGGNGGKGSTKTKTATATKYTGGIVDPNDTEFWDDWEGRPIGGGKITKTITATDDSQYTDIPDDPKPPTSSSVVTSKCATCTGSTSSSTTVPAKTLNTAPQPTLADRKCNSASDRSKWSCGGSYDLQTDHYKVVPNTGKIVDFDFVITNTTLNYDGVSRLALAVNGQVPGPIMEANWGDTIRVKITNNMQDNATTIHWHGIRQSGSVGQDGVPGVTECGIAPGRSKTYTFVANSYGTGWYHGHMLTHIGDGIRGPMVIHGPASGNYDIDMGPVMIDDLWNGVTVYQQNWRLAHAQQPTPAFNYMLNGHNVDANLTAGKHSLWTLTPGKKHLFRFINSASQNTWTVRIDKHTMTVIAADYVPIKPYKTEWLKIANGQRYDVIVEGDQPIGNYFLRAVTQTGCPASTTNNGLGSQNGVVTYVGANITLPVSDYGNATATFFNGCEDEPLASLVPVFKKDGGSAAKLSASLSTFNVPRISQLATTDDGTVNVWYINGAHMNINYTQPSLQTIAKNGSSTLYSNAVTVSTKDEWVYFVIQNQFNPSHPMHLHGHDLSLLGQGQGVFTSAMVSTLNFENPVRRDTIMLMGSQGARALSPGYTVIGFESDNPGAWLMHCHILWHADGGLALQWLERPSEISSDYVNSKDYIDECAAMGTYEAEGPWRQKSSGSSGLKRRTPFDETAREDVVRRADSAEKRYLENIAKRGVGDSFRRHARR